ncbi:MAG: T9SS type A sorting domain-containing protein [Muribaculaceae bacterium]|nr:T9SS type A sorting domain-containing protein [Muribaculaceae bacterium]
MIKKTFSLLIAALAFACASASNWQVLPSFLGSKIQNVVDAGDKVYYLASGCLYCFDKDTKENESLNRANYLNDVVISNIYYNDYRGYLMVVYDNSNIDIITDDGDIINMPDVKAASLTMSKAINDVNFTAKGRAYLATDFGYVVINDNKWEVLESHIFGQKVNSVAEMGSYLLLSQGAEIHYGLVGKHYETIGSMPLAKGSLHNDSGRLRALTDKKLLVCTGWTFTGDVQVDEAGEMMINNSESQPYFTNNVQSTPKGFLLNCINNDCYLTLDATGANFAKVDGGKQMYSAYKGGDGTLWAVGENGLHKATESTYYKPAALSFETPFYLVYNDAQRLLYVTSTGSNSFINDQYLPVGVNTFDGMTVKDVTPTPTIENGGSYYPVFSTSEENTYFMGNWWNGIQKVTDGKVVNTYNWENSPMEHALSGYYCHPTLAMDKGGNLWAAESSAPIGKNFFVLPKAKQAQKTVTESDWIVVNVPEAKATKRSALTTLTHSNVKIFSHGDFGGSLFFINDGGTPSAKPSTKAYSSGSLYDQDGNVINWNYIYTLTEDLNGAVWMGTNEGVLTFNPNEAFSGNFRLNHIKVPRNDGTNLADYLLNGIGVTHVAVDAANRKWIATNGSGLFLVSADGTNVISHFNTENSPLLSDVVYRVCCDPYSNAVYVTTSNGMMVYRTNSTPAENSYSNVYAYPNPVRPDYYGLITISGLMDNTLVKIADASGNVVKQLKSTGGACTWDGTVDGAERVRSGVYFVYVSQADGSEAAVTKILIVR